QRLADGAVHRHAQRLSRHPVLDGPVILHGVMAVCATAVPEPSPIPPDSGLVPRGTTASLGQDRPTCPPGAELASPPGRSGRGAELVEPLAVPAAEPSPAGSWRVACSTLGFDPTGPDAPWKRQGGTTGRPWHRIRRSAPAARCRRRRRGARWRSSPPAASRAPRRTSTWPLC